MVKVISKKNLLEVGAHFGHKRGKLNPKMKSFVFGSRNGVDIINLEKSVRNISLAYEEMKNVAQNNGRILFVGTKKQASEAVKKAAEECNVFYMNNRWLGGTLTNFVTIKKSIQELKKMEEVDRSELTKKEVSVYERKREKLEKNLSGIKDMDRLPDAIFVCDVTEDRIAVTEASKLGIKVFAVVDTDSDPTGVDYIIPANDDGARSIALMLGLMSDAIKAGRNKEDEEENIEQVEEEKEDNDESNKKA